MLLRLKRGLAATLAVAVTLNVYPQTVFATSVAPAQLTFASKASLVMNEVASIHGLKGMTASALKLYIGIGAMEIWDCFQKQDPTVCKAWAESLKDPIGHVSFAAFMVAERMVAKGLPVFTNGKVKAYPAHFLGLSAGVLAQSIVADVANSEGYQQLKKANQIQDPDQRWEARQAAVRVIWDETFARGGWWLTKVPEITSLAVAGVLSSLVIPATQAGLAVANGAVRSTFGRPIKVVTAAEHGLKRYRAHLGGTKGAIPGWIGFAASIGEILVFLNIHHLISEPMQKSWDLVWVKNKLHERENELGKSITRYYATGKEGDIPERVKELQEAFEEYREIFRMKAKQTHLRFAGELDAFEVQQMELYQKQQDLLNPRVARPHMEELMERLQLVDQFFCGREPEQAILKAEHFHGIPIPGRTSTKILPFKVMDTPAYCDGSGQASRLRLGLAEGKPSMLNRARMESAIDEAHYRLFTAMQSVREEIIQVHDEAVREDVRQGWIGDAASEGVIPSFKAEVRYWEAKINWLGPSSPESFKSALATAKAGLEASETFLAYSEASENEKLELTRKMQQLAKENPAVAMVLTVFLN